MTFSSFKSAIPWNLDSDSESETLNTEISSPIPSPISSLITRVSAYRVRDERLGKFCGIVISARVLHSALESNSPHRENSQLHSKSQVLIFVIGLDPLDPPTNCCFLTLHCTAFNIFNNYQMVASS